MAEPKGGQVKRAPKSSSKSPRIGVVYVGPLRPGVTITETGTPAPFGVEVKVEKSLGEALLDQEVWAKAGTEEAKAAKAAEAGTSEQEDESK
jgi:hypothetical protein